MKTKTIAFSALVAVLAAVGAAYPAAGTGSPRSRTAIHDDSGARGGRMVSRSSAKLEAEV